MTGIGRWLDQIGLAQYSKLFVESAIDVDVLPELTEQDLKDLGLPLGHRKRLLKAIAERHSGISATQASIATPAAGVAARGGGEAERRQLTVMFCDLVGSTALSQKLDPEDLGELINRYHSACAEVVTRYEGHVAKFLGDGILAYFGYPRAHEDDAERAVRAGLEIVETTNVLDPGGAPPLSVRVGIATGRVVVGDLAGRGREGEVAGETPNLAARLQALAEPNGVVIAPETHRLLGEVFEYADLGSHVLKGFDQPMRIRRVVGEKRVESRFAARRTGRLTALVGRDHEIALLLDRWRQAVHGEGQVVLLKGEPGIGKSHISETVQERLAEDAHIRLHFQCSPHQTNSVLHPIIEHVRRAAGIELEDPPEAKLAKLEAMLAVATDEIGGMAPLFAAMLSIPTGDRYPPLNLSPQRQRQETIHSLADQVIRLSQRHPVLMILEDAHWADPTTLEAFDLLIGRTRDARVLALITCRPEFQPAWRRHAHVTSLTLDRLSRRQCEAIVEQIAGGKTMPSEVLSQIVAKTDGIPLFVEELTKTVLEAGLLHERETGYVLDRPLPPLAIPSTLQDSLMARLDRLAVVKEVAQIAAAIGREFSHELLAAVVPLDEDRLQDALAQLIESELVFRREMPPAASYAFKHALIQDTAYQSLLKSKRQVLHACIAQVLEERFPDLAELQPEWLAHHLTEAGLREQAIAYWEKAGRRAIERFANQEAIRHLGLALELLGALPAEEMRDRRELRLRAALTVPLIALHGFGSVEVERCARRAKEISERLDETAHRFTVTRALWNSHLLRGPVPETLTLSAELLRLARATDDAAQLAVAHRAHGYALYIAGRPAASRDCLVRGIELADALDAERFRIYGEHPAMVCRAYGAQATIDLGEVDRGTALADEAVAVARRLGNPHTLAWALVVAAHARIFLREPKMVRALAEEAIELANEYRLPQWVAGATIFRGFAVAEGGDLQGGIAEMELGLAGWHSTGAVLHSTIYHGLAASACCAAGALDRSRTHLAAAFAHLDRFGERYVEAELHRVKAQLHREEGASAEKAEAALQQAMEIAGARGTRMQQLRATRDLARLWRDRGKRSEGRDLLAPVCGWFTEGFGTPDFKDAKALLHELV